MNFIGIALTEKSPLSQAIDEGVLLALTNFALTGEAPGVTQVLVETDGEEYVLASLSWPGHAQYATDVTFSDCDLTLKVKGAGTVHVTGSLQIDAPFGDSDDDMLMGDSDEFLDEMNAGGSSSGSEGDDEHPAHVGSKRIELLPEGGGSDSSSSSSSDGIKALPPQKLQQAAPAKQPQQQGKPQGQPQQGGKPQQGKPQQGGKPQGQPQPKPAFQQGKPPAQGNAFQPAEGKKKKRKNKNNQGGNPTGGDNKKPKQ